ncbi:MAG: universal stress protein [Desulfobacterales bacterium]|nr:universal stress protein [Desulfobacterales bacterium]
MRISPKHIMCAIDFSGFGPLIMGYGKALAREFQADLSLCHIIQDTVMLSSHAQAGFATEEVTAQRIEDAKEAIDLLSEEADMEANSIVSLGHPADEITRMAKKHGVDLVIAATHGGSGIKRFLVGSVTDRLVKTLECPLLVLHSDAKDHSGAVNLPLKRILVGCDFSQGSELAFDYALSLAQEFEAELHLVHVIKPHKQVELGSADYIKIQEGDYPGWDRSDFLHLQESAAGEEFERRKRLLNRLERQLGNMVPQDSRHWCTPVTSLRQGEPYLELLDYAQSYEIDMIVLGIHGHSLLEKFLVGSTTDRVISRAGCPVMAVRQTGKPLNS